MRDTLWAVAMVRRIAVNANNSDTQDNAESVREELVRPVDA